MNRRAIKLFLYAQDKPNALAEICKTTGICMRTASLKMQGRRQWTADEINAMRVGWGLTDEQTVEFFIK